MDGFFKRIDGTGPNVFLEVQGYDDPAVYWRLFREICTWYEQNKSPLPFIAIALFIDERFDPGEYRLTCVPPCQLIRRTLADGLGTIKDGAGALTVLRALVLSHKEELRERVPQWKSEIHSLGWPKNVVRSLIELLEYAILQRFPELTLKEIQKMIQLTPLEETVAGQELIRMGREEGKEEGKEEGREEGELIGKIQMAQRFLKRPITPRESLIGQNIKSLKALLDQLETELQ